MATLLPLSAITLLRGKQRKHHTLYVRRYEALTGISTIVLFIQFERKQTVVTILVNEVTTNVTYLLNNMGIFKCR